VERPTLDVFAMPVFVQGERKLPRLAKVRYDLLHKYLRAHLPELSDLGADFPSPERFAELGFQWLDFAWLGDGRMLLLYGPARGGAYLVWLDAGGFVKSAFYPTDAGTEPAVETDGDKLRVRVTIADKPVEQEMLFWGM